MKGREAMKASCQHVIMTACLHLQVGRELATLHDLRYTVLKKVHG
jgi:hypothetical protein